MEAGYYEIYIVTCDMERFDIAIHQQDKDAPIYSRGRGKLPWQPHPALGELVMPEVAAQHVVDDFVEDHWKGVRVSSVKFHGPLRVGE